MVRAVSLASNERGNPPVRVFRDLRDSGLLWLINRVVFHPRGWALGMAYRDGELIGWTLEGDGREPWSFPVDDEQALFEAAQHALSPRDDEG